MKENRNKKNPAGKKGLGKENHASKLIIVILMTLGSVILLVEGKQLNASSLEKIHVTPATFQNFTVRTGQAYPHYCATTPQPKPW